MKFNLFTIAAVAFSTVTSVVGTPVEVSPAKLLDRQTTTYLCGPSNPDTFGQLVSPKNGDTIYLQPGSSNVYTFEVIYCSAQYFKTRSIGLTVGLARPSDAQNSGQILALDYKPSSEAGVSQPGYYGYKFNVTIYPSSGSIFSGSWIVDAGEVATGYYNAYNYYIKYAQINLAAVVANS